MRLSKKDCDFQDFLDTSREKWGEERVSNDYIKKLALDTFEGKVFIDKWIKDDTPRYCIFPVLIFAEKLDIPWDTQLFYGYYHNSCGRAINGYPIFMELGYLRPKAYKLYCEYLSKLDKIKQEFQ